MRRPARWSASPRSAALVIALLLLVTSLPAGSATAPILSTSGVRTHTDLGAMVADAYAYDNTDHGELIFGNLGNPGANQTWFQNPDGWINETGPSGPSARLFPAMAYDPLSGGVVLFGGKSAAGGVPLNDTWEYRSGSWTQLFPRAAPPASYRDLDREMVFDPLVPALVLVLSFPIIPGSYSSTNLSTWSFSNDNWTEIGSQAVNAVLAPGFGSVLSYDSLGSSLVLPNAFNSSTYRQEVLSYRYLGGWSISPNGELPVSGTVLAAAEDPPSGAVVGLESFWLDRTTLRHMWPTFLGGSSGWTNITSSAGQPVALWVPFEASRDPVAGGVLLLGETSSSTPTTGPSIWTFSQGKWSGPSTPGFIHHTINTGSMGASLPWFEIAVVGVVVVAAVAVAAVTIALVLHRRRRAPPAVPSVTYPSYSLPPPPPPT